MATLDEILQLDKVQSSIRKIDLFVSQKTKYSPEYMKALAYKALVLHNLDKTNDALKLLYEYVPEFGKMDAESVVAICSSIIDITIDSRVFEQASKYIRIKQTYLPISRANEYIKDTTRLYLAKRDYQNAKDALLKYLDDDITKDEEVYALEHLCDIYYMEQDFDKYLRYIPRLESYYQTSLDISKQEIIGKNRIEIAYLRKNYLAVIIDGMKFLKEYENSAEHTLWVSSFVMESYIQVKDYKKAAIIESDYEEYVSDEFLEASISFCSAAIRLYSATNTAPSVIEYRHKLEALEALKNPVIVPKQEKKKTTKPKAEIVIPTLVNEPEPIKLSTEEFSYNPIGVLNPKTIEPEIVTQKIVENIKEVKNIQVSEYYKKIEKIMEGILNIKEHVKFRECFRLSCIEMEKEFPIDEIYLLYFLNGYHGLHYKKERAYDKKINIEEIEKTVNYQALEHGRESYLDPSDETYNMNIVTKEEYEGENFAIAFPLVNSISTIASLAFISKKPFLGEEMCYESLKLISKVVNTKLLGEYQRIEEEKQHEKNSFLVESITSGIKENRDGFYTLSPIAQSIFGSYTTMMEDDFLIHLSSKDASIYKNALAELYDLSVKNKIIEYSYNRDGAEVRVREIFYPVLRDGVLEIYSMVDDITEYYKERENLIELAYHDSNSKLSTDVKLYADLELEYDTRKCSLAVIDVIDSQLYKEIYGRNFYRQVILAVGMKLKAAFENDFDAELYHLDGTTYAVFLRGQNDRRIIDSKLKAALGQAKMELYELNHRVKICFNAGVYRLSKNSNLKNASDMLAAAQDALIDAQAMEGKENHIAHFDSQANKERFMENSMVTEISEALDYKHLSVMYKQIIDLEHNIVLGLNLSLNMDSMEIEEKEMKKVVRRKGIISHMDRYLIENCFKEEKLFHDSTKSYLNVFIPISRETLEERLPEYLISKQNFYKIDPKYVTLVADSIYGTSLETLRSTEYHLASKDILDVYRGLCDYFFYDYHSVNKDSIPEILDLCKKHNVICVLSGIDEKLDYEMAKESGYRFIFGNYFKRRNRIKDILEKVTNDK